MAKDESSEPTGEEAVAGWGRGYEEGNDGFRDNRLKVMLRRLITIMGVLTGTIAGVGVTFLIGFIAEAITQPDYPDLMTGVYLVTIVVCVPLFAVVSGVLF